MEGILQPSLFDSQTIATATAPKLQAAVAGQKPAGTIAPTFVSPLQRDIMQHSRYAFYFRGKTIGQIEEIHKKMSGEFYRKSRQSLAGGRNLSEWYRAMWASQTIALEEAYASVDARFLEATSGEFWLIGKKRIKVRYEYTPCIAFECLERTTVPAPHFVFRTDEESEISETCYRSHFLTFIPYDAVQSMEDLLTQIVASHFKAIARFASSVKSLLNVPTNFFRKSSSLII